MGFRFRLGPFTFGRTGARLSLWAGGAGFSTPLSGKGRTFGKIGFGPISWFGQSGESNSPTEDKLAKDPHDLLLEEAVAINAFRADHIFLKRLQQNGMPWRRVQERLKEELPIQLGARDRAAYALVPKALSAVFGPQGTGWSTEKRLSKDGSRLTTWIVVQ